MLYKSSFLLSILSLVVYVLSPSLFLNQQVHALSNGLALTPPMGWNTYYSFGCNPTDQLIRTTADAMVNSGLKAAGYQYVNIDDCWSANRRDRNGNLTFDKQKFPNGIKSVADYVHSKGLKIGIYADAGTQTCSGRPGSYGYEEKDAKLFASWGIDFVKVDWCNTNGIDAKTVYGKWRDAITVSGRPMVFNICNWGEQTPWVWGPQTGHSWRTWYDISWYKDTTQYQTEDHWGDVLRNLDKNAAHAPSASPGSWNDPDYLQIGMGSLTPDEEKSQFSMWAMMASPLTLSNDIRSMTTTTKNIITNTEVIAVNQDPLGKQGIKISENNGLQVWARKLQADGTRAVVLFNRQSSPANITVNWNQIGLNNTASVRDLWTKQDLGSFTDSYTTQVPAHGVVMLKVQGTESNTPMILSVSTGISHAETVVNDSTAGSVSWSNVWDANSSNNWSAYATISGQDSHYIEASSLKLGVPDNATITGIKADIEKRSEKGINRDYSVFLQKNNANAGVDHWKAETWPTTDTVVSYGSETDLWGTTWTPNEVNSKGFGIALSAHNDIGAVSDTSYIDNMTITVYYTLPNQ